MMWYDPKYFEIVFCIVLGFAIYGFVQFVRWII
jgi:hypothetical protein